MKILFYTPFPPAKETGACKVVLELAEEMELLGWECKVVGPPEVAATLTLHQQSLSPSERLRQYLIENAEKYDVVDYEHPHLPFPRSDFSSRPLFVARSVMLLHHIERHPIPVGRGIRSKIGHLIKGKERAQRLHQDISRCFRTIQQADLVNLCNDDEKETLTSLGISSDKIVVLPFGISRTRRPLFDAISSELPTTSIVAFVGSFDYRKGANEFPAIVKSVSRQMPNVRFRLLGTAGMFPTKQSVLKHFPKSLWPFLEIIPKFPAGELPTLLGPCSVGLFPSRVEGFPFGVLEMLAASLPVVAYDVPGPRMTLPANLLAKPGDAANISDKLVELLNNRQELRKARAWAKQKSREYNWKDVAEATSQLYYNHVEQRRKEPSEIVG